MDIQEEIELIEKELLELIIAHLENNKLNTEKAQQLAKDFLAILPVQDQKDLLSKLKQLGEEYDEARELYVEELGKASDQIRHTTLTKMRDAIQKGNIEHALTIAQASQQQSIH